VLGTVASGLTKTAAGLAKAELGAVVVAAEVQQAAGGVTNASRAATPFIQKAVRIERAGDAVNFAGGSLTPGAANELLEDE